MELSLPKLLLLVLVSLMVFVMIIKYIRDSSYYIPKPKNMTPYEFIQERLDMAIESSNPASELGNIPDTNEKPITIRKESKEKKERHQEIVNERHEGRLTLLENAVNQNLEDWRRNKQAMSIPNNISKYNLKEGWCFIGKDRGFRSCLPVGKRDMCLSENVYPTREICVHPALRFTS